MASPSAVLQSSQRRLTKNRGGDQKTKVVMKTEKWESPLSLSLLLHLPGRWVRSSVTPGVGLHQHTSDFSSSAGRLLLQFSIAWRMYFLNFRKIPINEERLWDTFWNFCRSMHVLQVHASFSCVHGYFNCNRQINGGVGEENEFNHSFFKAEKEQNT